MPKFLYFFAVILLFFSTLAANAQEKTAESQVKQPETQPEKKANQRPADYPTKEKFDDADVKTMANQCIRLETEQGSITMEMFPESAPETVRNFLNLTALGVFDTTTFSRVVPGFIVQGGDITTRETRTNEMTRRAYRTIPDEPSQIKHERGIVSMARRGAPNSASSNFFILVGSGSHLDGAFAAFGRVTSGMDVVDAINKMSVEGEKPEKPVKIKRALVEPCAIETGH